MTDLMIDKLNKEKEICETVKLLFISHMTEDLAELKTNEVMRVTGHYYNQMSADDNCPYCAGVKRENGDCKCINQ